MIEDLLFSIFEDGRVTCKSCEALKTVKLCALITSSLSISPGWVLC
jgi:hypothetical protein